MKVEMIDESFPLVKRCWTRETFKLLRRRLMLWHWRMGKKGVTWIGTGETRHQVGQRGRGQGVEGGSSKVEVGETKVVSWRLVIGLNILIILVAQ